MSMVELVSSVQLWLANQADEGGKPIGTAVGWDWETKAGNRERGGSGSTEKLRVGGLVVVALEAAKKLPDDDLLTATMMTEKSVVSVEETATEECG